MRISENRLSWENYFMNISNEVATRSTCDRKHVGAVIVRDNKVIAARCVLPVTNNTDFPSHLGMRHRAAAGISEDTDAIVIIVSEQNGEISFAKEGKLHNQCSIEKLEKLLRFEADKLNG